jgi:fructose-1,6-bisphosphatase/inositol monophosphatase family enzyme
MPSLQTYQTFAEALAKEAGVIARKHFSHSLAFDSKSDSTPVTAADLEINEVVIARCRETFPEVGIIGEESSDVNEEKLVWVCDPIDGTTPYSLGMGISTFCLALVDDGEPVMGIVYDFTHDRLFSAVKGGQATLNGEVIEPANTPMKLVDFEWWGGSPFALEGVHTALFAKGYQVPNFVSSGYVETLLAQRRIAGVVYSGVSPWDVAASKVIAEACGCRVTSLFGEAQRYDQAIKGAILTQPEFYDDIATVVKQVLGEGE